MTKQRKLMYKLMSCLLTACFAFGVASAGWDNTTAATRANSLTDAPAATTPYFQKTDASLIRNDITSLFDPAVVHKLPEAVEGSDDLTVIVTMNTGSIIDAYNAANTSLEVKDYVLTDEAIALAESIEKEQNALLKTMDKAGVRYELGDRYDTLLSGFEVTIKAKDFDKLNSAVSDKAALVVSEVYNPSVTEVVTNDVKVYETGIFDSSDSEYQGDGVVVAVLDSGLDYTHTAFNATTFENRRNQDVDLALTFDAVQNKVGQTVAASFSSGLTGEDVYVSSKIPFAYDYADKDPDVLPVNSAHGTHVSGVIAGHDDRITGVAPNAQIAFMKVFSDKMFSAKQSWILSGLEDCVVMGVDVINMSLGSSCGFSREVDKVATNIVYDKIRDAGISLVVAAGNEGNATQTSEKNGANPLTTNPDAGTVGAPAAYPVALSVASVDGVKTSYIKYEDQIIYFNEAFTGDGQAKRFATEILDVIGEDSYEFEYVTIPGVGRSSDYGESADYYAGKIALVKRGITTFEEKVRIALKEKGAAGIIIYNNVSGPISMSVGEGTGPVCSITQDEGELMAQHKTGKISISRDQVAGPFMSNFSSWGPTSDLKIKPEITAHGGEILSAIPGQDYEQQSGTSMASPNLAGAAALVRQYVKYSGVFDEDLTAIEVTALVNQLMMSTADIVYNKNGLPYAVRKQGAGLVNLVEAATSEAYLTTYEKDEQGNTVVMPKSKLELGDDKQKTGKYRFTVAVNNITNVPTTYEVGSIIQTEGVSENLTQHDKTTSTQEGYMLDAKTTVVSVSGRGTQDGNLITVEAGKSCDVTIEIELSEEDKAYLNKSFAYGMFVEGFVTFTAGEGAEIDLNVPLLAFYGNWLMAPTFDEEFFDTDRDAMNNGLDYSDKVVEDAYATRIYGGFYSDYISTLGTYPFIQDPAAVAIPANKEHIALSNYENGPASAVNSIDVIYAGLLRNAKKAVITITDDATGEVIWTATDSNIYKSIGKGGSPIDVEFYTREHNLKNNTQYTVTVKTYVDYGTEAEQDAANVRNVFEFPLYIDFSAPVLTDVEYRVVYDKTAKKNKLYADLYIYDNHHAMAVQMGIIKEADYASTGYYFDMETMGKYPTAVYSEKNSTTKVTIEMTDYVNKIKTSVRNGGSDENGNVIIEKNANSFIALCYDYACNSAVYEVRLPDEVVAMYFTKDIVYLSPNQPYEITSADLKVYPEETWLETLTFEVPEEDAEYLMVANQTIVAKKSGDAVVKAVGYTRTGEKIVAELPVHIYSSNEDNYSDKYSQLGVNKFTIPTYTTNRAYYFSSGTERDIGVDGGTYDFGNSSSLSMYPSESVTLNPVVDAYQVNYSLAYSSGNENIATVDQDGKITAKAKGSTGITVNVLIDGEETRYSKRIDINVKDPYTFSGAFLQSYRGGEKEVIIPANRQIIEISSYAFSGSEWVEKDVAAGDIIDEEDPAQIKQVPIGDNMIERIVIPEGVETIAEYAFAKLVALEEVVLPSTLKTIGMGAFMGCTNLTTVVGLEHVKFINADAFHSCAIREAALDSVVAIGVNAFFDNKIKDLILPKTAQSVADSAFENNTGLQTILFNADKVKIGAKVFANCSKLETVEINAAVISANAFMNCSKLTTVKLGKDVAVIGEYAFYGTAVAEFQVSAQNRTLKVSATTNIPTSGSSGAAYERGPALFKQNELVAVAPKYKGPKGDGAMSTDATTIGVGAFAANYELKRLVANNVVTVKDYAFAECIWLTDVTMDNVVTIGNRAFSGASLTKMFNLSNVKTIGDYAFAGTMMDLGNGYTMWNTQQFTTLTLPAGVHVGEGAFYFIPTLETVTIGANAVLGEGAFLFPMGYYTIENILSSNTFETQEELDQVLEELITLFYKPYTYTVYDDEGNVFKEHTFYEFDPTVVNGNDPVSRLTKVTLGEGVIVGFGAFQGNLLLETLEFTGGNVVIDGYAFINLTRLTNVDFTKIKSVGEYAFAGLRSNHYEYVVNDNGDKQLNYGFKYKVIDGEEVPYEYLFSQLAPALERIDLTNVIMVGEGAFCNIMSADEIVFKSEDAVVADPDAPVLDVIAPYAFANCTSAVFTLPSYILEIGEYAFMATGVTEADLQGVAVLGEAAFAQSKIKKITLQPGAEIGDLAFMYCEELSEVVNLNEATVIGNSAFRGTKLTSVDLSAATYIGFLAFADSSVTEVTFGSALTKLGQNPFWNCDIASFGKYVKADENSDLLTFVDTYDITDKVKVIDGSLYQTLPNGMELVSYPKAKQEAEFTVAHGTIRIGQCAAAGATFNTVILPSTLRAVGDKAFYGCENLKLVVFTSYYAPRLEEEYDANRLTYDNVPMTGTVNTSMGDYEGLGIVKYYMWSFDDPSFFMGANFVDYVGHLEKIAMVKPTNGEGYGAYQFTYYFESILNGKNAATAETEAVIAMIDAIPEKVTLDHGDAIDAALAAYDQISSIEQQALVTNYAKLVQAKKNWQAIHDRVYPPEVEPGPSVTPDEKDTLPAYARAIIIVLGVLVLAELAFVLVYIFVIQKKKVSAKTKE